MLPALTPRELLDYLNYDFHAHLFYKKNAVVALLALKKIVQQWN